MNAWLLLTTLLAAAADDEPSWKREGFGFGGIPAVNYNSDEGLGLGAVGSIYRYNGQTSPYKVGVTFVAFVTTKGIHSHYVQFDVLKLANDRLRISGRAHLEITRTNNFCGLGPDVTCDPAVAEAAAEEQGLEGEARETFVRRYYLSSFIRPNLFVNGRYRLNPDQDVKVEAMGGIRSAYHLPGVPGDRNPDPGNLISTRLDQEQGFMNLLQIGAMVDTRDFESAPKKGYWVEGSVRGASRVIGSEIEYFGFNLTGRTYVPLGTEHLVLATRLAFDGIAGDAPIRELAQMGGSQIYTFGGGLNAGRGIRQRRYLGRAKTLLQPELRVWAIHAEPFKIPVDIDLLGFWDVMTVAEDWTGFADSLGKPVSGFGGGLRLAFDANFIIRVDMGVSPKEDFAPSLYIDLNNLF